MARSTFKPVSLALSKPTQKIGGKRGFHDRTILSHWKDFVGEELARLCQPREIKSGRGRGSLLILECVSAHASELTMRSEEIRAKINASLGFDAIARIQFHHQHLGFDQKKAQPPAPQAVKRDVPSVMGQELANTDNDALRKALNDLTYEFYNKGA